MTPSQSIRTFATWLECQVDRNDPIGDLARDFEDDHDAPRGIHALRFHMTFVHHACPGARKALDDAICEWREAKRAWLESVPWRRELRS